MSFLLLLYIQIVPAIRDEITMYSENKPSMTSKIALEDNKDSSK
jgi:hypothetical protein